MPNWCANRVTIIGSKKNLNQLIKDSTTSEGFFKFNCLIPINENINPDDKTNISQVEHQIDMWGTKWDLDDEEHLQLSLFEIDSDKDLETIESISFGFETAWTPPTPIYSLMREKYNLHIVASAVDEAENFIATYLDGQWTGHEDDWNKYYDQICPKPLDDYDDDEQTEILDKLDEWIEETIDTVNLENIERITSKLQQENNEMEVN
ncbi:hypothetical protein ELUMI_v1c05040 [Williamsoniiplasma luminosum]|uniref:YubB ferredoxin-like domain-containing protein n=1 Tax=Williamsoniiplasma luminosum TaxID=214888 RepID=A0A2K8NVM2_9MOLU|nr:hypothetical protein [Williamsoniiplasma luminosum]ATZ17228.1 hypothetical protein ELUMI_v1c05040 [Williamsoniiplasma luminosum]